jgi:hypothetical protein
MTDAGFEDGADRPIALIAQEVDDLPVLSALVQDAVFPLREMAYVRPRRRFAILLSRFRWEDRARAKAMGRSYERVQSLLVVHDVLAVRSTGFDPNDKDVVLALLGIHFAATTEGAGRFTLTLSGGGAIELEVEALDATLRDVTRPHLAKSVPDHGL